MFYVRRPCLCPEEGFILSLSQQIIPESSTSHRRWMQLPQNVVFGFGTWMHTSFRSTTFMPSSVTETEFTQIVWDSVIRRKMRVVPGNEHLYRLFHETDSRRPLTAEVRVRSEVIPSDICGWKLARRQDSLPLFRFSPCLHHSTNSSNSSAPEAVFLY